MKSVWFAALAAAPVFCCAPVQAQSLPSTDSNATTLDPVIVTATRTPQTQSSVGAATIVIDRAQIEAAQATDVADILSRQAGIEIGRTGGPGQPASLFIRGGNSNYTLVLIDGVRVNEGALGLPALNNITPEMIERIEIVEGPRSALYGADAIGGVVNIITRTPGPAQLDAEVGGGSFGTVQGGGTIRGEGHIAGAPVGLVITGTQQHSDGLPTFRGSDDDRGFDNRTLAGRATLEVAHVKIEARGWDASGNTQYSNTVFDENFAFAGFAPLDHDFHNQALALAASTKLTSNWQSDLTLSRGVDNLTENQSTDYVRTVRPGADWHNVVDFSEHNRLSFGALGYRERVDASSAFAPHLAENRTNVYGYVEDEINYGAHRALGAVNYLSDSHFGERFNWNAEYSYLLPTATRLIAAAGTAFHAPTADDRFIGFGGNPDLKPEKAQNYEVAVRQTLGRQTAELRLFRTDVRDLIAFVPPNFTAVNVQHSRSEGVQLGWSYTDAFWIAHANGIWQNPRNRDTDTQLLRRARVGGSADVSRKLGRFELGGAVHSQSQRHDVGATDFAPTTDGGYALFDLTASARLTRQIRLDLRVDNLFNHHYETAAGYNQPGTAGYATLRYSLPLQ